MDESRPKVESKASNFIGFGILAAGLDNT